LGFLGFSLAVNVGKMSFLEKWEGWKFLDRFDFGEILSIYY